MTSYKLWIAVRYTLDTEDEYTVNKQVEAVEEALRDAVLEPDAGSVTFELEEADAD